MTEPHPTIRPQPGVLEIAPYVGGESRLTGHGAALKLSSNENPFGPGAAARAAFAGAADSLHRYPSSDHRGLREAIARVHRLDPARIVCGAGSDEIISFLTQAYAGVGTEVVHTEHGFGLYRIYALAAGATPVEVRERERRTDVDAILAACGERTALVFIANPNNPTGTMISEAEVARLAAGLPPQALLVLDGAYAEYVEGFDGHAGLVDARDNVAMTRTFSKIYGLGGLRVGWGYGPAHVTSALGRVRGPFNLSTAQLAAAEAAVGDADPRPCLPRRKHQEPRLARGRARARRRPLRPLRGELPARPLPRPDGGRGLRRGAPGAGDHRAPGRELQAAGVLAHHHRRRRGLRAGRRGGRGVHAGPRLMPYAHVALIGLGLIASSISHAMRRAGMEARITGHARTAETRAEASRLGLAEVLDTAGAAVEGADLVVLAVPVGAMAEVAAEIAPHLAPGATVTDVGSVKRAVIDAVAPLLPAHARFVPGHPLAGTEHSGPGAGFASLFDSRWCLLTPLPDADPEAVAELAAFWTALGARVDTMDPDHHDLVLAVTSHVPHLIAYTMVGVADHLRRVTAQEVINYSAAGFRDFTRIAASDPTMWRDVFLANKDATLDILGRFTEELLALQRAIRLGDGGHLHAYFTRTRAIRRGIIEAGQDTAAPDFGRGSGG